MSRSKGTAGTNAAASWIRQALRPTFMNTRLEQKPLSGFSGVRPSVPSPNSQEDAKRHPELEGHYEGATDRRGGTVPSARESIFHDHARRARAHSRLSRHDRNGGDLHAHAEAEEAATDEQLVPIARERLAEN
jgi:hypothetical protein